MRKIYSLSDIINIFKIRIKLLCSSKKLIIIFIFFLLLTGGIMLSYEKVANEKNTLPIGIVDLDNTLVTKNIIKEINNNNLLRVVTGTKKDLMKKLRRNEIFSIFVLEEGFANRLLSLDTNEIIEDNYSSENMVSKVISDAVLAGILDEICYTYCNKTYYKNTKLYSSVMEEEQYKKYIQNIYEKESKTLAFNFNIVNAKDVVDDKKLDTAFMYKEIIFAISALVSIIVVMIIGNVFIDDRRLGTDKRYIICGTNRSAVILGDALASIVVSSVFALVVGGLLVKQLDIESIDKIIKIMLLIFLFECTISMLFVLLSKTLNDFVSYQLIGSTIILVVGISGALYILGFLINDNISEFAMYTPIGLLINGYKNIILGSNISLNILFFIVQSIIMYILTYIVDYYKKCVF